MLLAAGALFLAFGLIALLSYDRGASSISDRAYVVALGGIFFLIGCVVFTAAATTSAVYIRHAAAEVLANVPREPVLVEGANVHGRLTHELVETTDGWHFRPASRNWRNDRRFLLGFGVPFLLFAAGVLSWFLHRDGTARNWLLAILTGGFITVSIGGTVFWVMAAMLRWSYGRLPSLVIARGGEALAYEGPMPVEHNRDWLKYGFAGNPERQQLSIPRAVGCRAVVPLEVRDGGNARPIDHLGRAGIARAFVRRTGTLSAVADSAFERFVRRRAIDTAAG